jgi:fructose-1,6-bisphosphatase
MHDVLRDRIWRNLEALPDERLYQVLDYIEFLGSKYARDKVRQPSPLRAFGERLEDKLRVNRVGMSAIRGTLGVVGTADRMVTGLAEVGRSVLREVGVAGTSADAGQPVRPPSAPPRSVAPPEHSVRPEDIPVDG